jgi:ribonuclease HI
MGKKGKAGGKKFYAVRVGAEVGVFESWSVVQPLVVGFRGAKHKSFPTYAEAEAFVRGEPIPSRRASGGGGAASADTARINCECPA